MKTKIILLIVLVLKIATAQAELTQDLMKEILISRNLGIVGAPVKELIYRVNAIEPNIKSVTFFNPSRAFVCRQIGDLEVRVELHLRRVNEDDLQETIASVKSTGNEFENLLEVMHSQVRELGDSYCDGSKSTDQNGALAQVARINATFGSIKATTREMLGVDRYNENLEFIRK